MDIFGFKVVKSDEIKKLTSQIDELNKRLSSSGLDDVLKWGLITDGVRPSVDIMTASNLNAGARSITGTPAHKRAIYSMFISSQVLANILLAIKNETFRRGLEIKPKFSRKCKNCKTEYKKEVKFCKHCGSMDLVEPSQDEFNLLRDYVYKINHNKQTLLELCETLEFDLDLYDDMFLVCVKKYIYNSDGKIIKAIPVEFVKADSLVMSIIIDTYGRLGYTDNGQKTYFCPRHRDNLILKKPDETNLKCERCGGELLHAIYHSGIYDSSDKQYYAGSEVLHKSKYFPSMAYGIPPATIVWKELMILVGMKKTMMFYYIENRPPKGFLVINATDQQQADRAIEEAKNEYRSNPTAITPLRVYNATGADAVKFIEVMRTPEELQMIDTQQELMREIGAVYNVMPIWMSDISQSGGLNNESQQIIVTNRGIEKAQGIFNNYVFPWICQQLGISDWYIELRPSELMDELREKQIFNQEIINAQGLVNLGYEVDYDEDSNTFKITGKLPTKPLKTEQEQQMFIEGLTGENKLTTDIEKAKLNDIYQKRAGELENKLRQAYREHIGDIRQVKTFAELNEKVGKIATYFIDNMKSILKVNAQKEYEKAIKDVETETKMSIGFGVVDKIAIDTLLSDDKLLQSYKNFFGDIHKTIIDVFLAHYRDPKAFTLDVLTKALARELAEYEYKFETLARTEFHNISTWARYNSYAKIDPGTFKYKWISIPDNRRTEFCKTISEKTKEGVTLAELKQIIKEHADKNIYSEERPFLPHINCRSTFVRIS